MPSFKSSSLSGWKSPLLLFLLAVSILVVGYRIDKEDNQPTDVVSRNPSRASEARSLSESPASGTTKTPDTHANAATTEQEEPDTFPAETSPPGKRINVNPGRPVRMLHGRVVDVSGSPVTNAHVRLGEREVRTNSRGEFSFPWATVDLRVEHENFFPRSLRAEERRELARSANTSVANPPSPTDVSETPNATETSLTIVLFLANRISGHVHNESNQPIVDAKLRFSPLETGTDIAASSGTIVKSRSDGSYESPRLHPGQYQMLVQHPEYQPQTETLILTPREIRSTRDVVLSAGKRLRLVVRDSRAEVLPDSRVWLVTRRQGEESEETQFLGLTNDAGVLECRLTAANPVKQWVRVSLPGYRETRKEVVEDEIVMTVEVAPRLDGVAIDTETGLPQSIHKVRLEMETGEGYRRVPDQGILFHSLSPGNFRIGLPTLAGTYRVLVEAEGRLAGTSEPIFFDGTTSPPRFTVRMTPQGGMQGIVLADEAIPHGVAVELYRDIPAPGPTYHGLPSPKPIAPYRITRTDSRGRFKFGDIEPGSYRLRAHSPNHAPVYSAPVSAPASESIPMVLIPGVSLQGRVLNADKEPESNVPLILTCLDRPFPSFALSDESGSYRFDHLAEGRYILLPGDDSAAGSNSIFNWDRMKSNFASSREKRQVINIDGQRNVSFDLHLSAFPWGSVTGVLHSNGNPLANMEAQLIRLTVAEDQKPEAGGTHGLYSRELRTNGEGHFRAHGLSPGRYVLRSSYPPWRREFTIDAGRKLELDVKLTRHSLAVEILHAGTGRPVPTLVRSRIYRVPGNVVTHRSRPKNVTNGPLQFDKLYTGSYRIEIRATGFLPTSRTFEIGDDDHRLRIALRPGVPMQVTIPTPTGGGTPIRGLGRVVLTRGGVEAYRYEGYLDGQVVLPELEPGIYHMTVQSGGRTVRSSFQVRSGGRRRTD